MTTTVQRRLIGFLLAIAIAAGLLGWAGHTALRQGADFSETLVREQMENFRIGDQFESELHQLRGLISRFEIHHDPSDWMRFQQEQKALDAWLDERRQHVTTAAERAVLEEIDDTYDDYFSAAKNLDAELNRGTAWPGLAPRVERIVDEFVQLGQFAGKLLRAHRSGLAGRLDASRRDLGRMRGLLFGALTALLVLGVLFAIVWRDMIQPLRRRLVESQDLVARQEKLASLGVLAAGVAHEIRNPLTVLLEVADTGPGVLPEVRDRLFDPFFTTKETGTGLGLAIAQRIVEKHGGAIELQTAPGHGALFGIVLPEASPVR